MSDLANLKYFIREGLKQDLIGISIYENSLRAEIDDYWFWFGLEFYDEDYDISQIGKRYIVDELYKTMIDMYKDPEDRDIILNYYLYLKENIK